MIRFRITEYIAQINDDGRMLNAYDSANGSNGWVGNYWRIISYNAGNAYEVDLDLHVHDYNDHFTFKRFLYYAEDEIERQIKIARDLKNAD